MTQEFLCERESKAPKIMDADQAVELAAQVEHAVDQYIEDEKKKD